MAKFNTNDGRFTSTNNPVSDVFGIVQNDFVEHFIYIDYSRYHFSTSEKMKLKEYGLFKYVRGRHSSASSSRLVNLIGELSGNNNNKMYVYISHNSLLGLSTTVGDYILMLDKKSNIYEVNRVLKVTGIDSYNVNGKHDYTRFTCDISGIDVDIRNGDLFNIDDTGQIQTI